MYTVYRLVVLTKIQALVNLILLCSWFHCKYVIIIIVEEIERSIDLMVLWNINARGDRPRVVSQTGFFQFVGRLVRWYFAIPSNLCFFQLRFKITMSMFTSVKNLLTLLLNDILIKKCTTFDSSKLAIHLLTTSLWKAWATVASWFSQKYKRWLIWYYFDFIVNVFNNNNCWGE